MVYRTPSKNKDILSFNTIKIKPPLVFKHTPPTNSKEEREAKPTLTKHRNKILDLSIASHT